MEKELTYISSKGYVPEAVWQFCLGVYETIPSTVVVFFGDGPVFLLRHEKEDSKVATCTHLRNGIPLSLFWEDFYVF